MLGAKHGLGVEPGIAAAGDAGVALRASAQQFVLRQQHLDASFFDAQSNAVAGSHEPKRAANGALRRRVQNDGAKRRSAHPRVGDAHHVLDARSRQLGWNRKVARLRHARSDWSRVLQDQHVLGRTSSAGSSMRAARSSRFSKTTARPTCSNRRSSAAAHLRMAPFGAMLPNRASSPPVALKGLVNGTYDASIDERPPMLQTFAERFARHRLTVELSSGRSSWSTAPMPPAAWKSSM